MLAATITNLMTKTVRAMWDAEWYAVAPGETRVFPKHVAEHIKKNYPDQWTPDTDPPVCIKRVELKEHDGPLPTLVSVPLTRFTDPVTGIEYQTYDEFIQAITKRVEVEVSSRLPAPPSVLPDSVTAAASIRLLPNPVPVERRLQR